MPGAAIVIFANQRIKSPVSDMSDIGDEIRQHLPSVSIPTVLYGHCCELPVKPASQIGRFYPMTFQMADNSGE